MMYAPSPEEALTKYRDSIGEVESPEDSRSYDRAGSGALSYSWKTTSLPLRSSHLRESTRPTNWTCEIRSYSPREADIRLF